MNLELIQGDCLDVLPTLEAGSVHCCVTSPPYWGLRDYGVEGQLGLEATPEEYVAKIVEVFRAVRRVLRDDGTLWLNMGDSYCSQPSGSKTIEAKLAKSGLHFSRDTLNDAHTRARLESSSERRLKYVIPPSLKQKDLIGIPWAVAKALQAPYYTGTIRHVGDRIWLAAMIDAEGCIFIHKRKAGRDNGQGYKAKKDSYGAGLEVSNTSRAIPEKCLRITGKGSICTQESGKFGRKQTLYRWNIRSNECRGILKEIYPHLVAKQHEARLTMGCPVDGDKAIAAHASLKGIHQGYEPSIDFPAPQSMFEPGWYLRSDIIWAKLNPMPESCTDRPTKSHEYLFLLTKSAKYFYDADAIREPHKNPEKNALEIARQKALRTVSKRKGVFINNTVETWEGDGEHNPAGRNKRSVWTISTQAYPKAHFATFPEALVLPCILAGTSEEGCCAECGAPWERVVEVSEEYKDWAKTQRYYGEGGKGSAFREAKTNSRTAPIKGHTKGWQPTCTCDADKVPCTVLDPFLGSGTTAKVAQQYGRSFVGCELSAEYLELARDRFKQARLFA